jgi:hypothetical protein
MRGSRGITGDDAGLIADGHTVCAALAVGHSADSLSETYYDNATSLSHAQADAAVNFAIKDLCPTGRWARRYTTDPSRSHLRRPVESGRRSLTRCEVPALRIPCGAAPQDNLRAN